MNSLRAVALAAMLGGMTHGTIVPDTFGVRRRVGDSPQRDGAELIAITEADRVALAKAEAKRERKAAKRLKNITTETKK